jgi:hypothetical protein
MGRLSGHKAELSSISTTGFDPIGGDSARKSARAGEANGRYR